MNKRILLFLFSILALTLSVNSNWDASVYTYNGTQRTNVSAAKYTQSHLPYSATLGKTSSHLNKNRMRIKAWDDCFAVLLPNAWTVVAPVYYHVSPVYSHYRSSTSLGQNYRHHLRGPPTV